MAVIGTAGHVDHGKSALVERLTGIDPDRFEEEKRRGLTIDLGFAWLTLPSGREVGVVDVPGHERFVRNMLAGAGGLSACLFVVAANEGWKPQSAEHLAIVDTLGIRHGVVALTKCDLVDEERLEEIRSDVESRISITSLAGASIVACSALTGAGLEELLAQLDGAVAAAGEPVDEGRPRLWIDRVFTIKGAGTVVTGTLAGGSLRSTDEVRVEPQGARARIRSIQTHKKHVDGVGPATRVALNIAGLERADAARGDAIVSGEGWRSTRRFDAAVRVVPTWATGEKEQELTARGSHLLYVGSAEIPVRVRLLGSRRLTSGESGFARLTLRDPLPLQRGDRFVLRDAGRVLTLGGGTVLDPLPGAADVKLLQALRGTDGTAALRALVETEGSIGSSEALLRARTTTIPEDVHELGATLYSPARFRELTQQLRATIAEHHRAHPLERGMPLEAARASMRMEARTFDALVRQVEDVVEEDRVVRSADHRVALSPQQERQRSQLISELDARGFTPPLENELQIDRALLHSLIDAGELVKISNFVLTREQALDAQKRVRDHISEHGPATVAQLRDLFGTTRKYAVPLCEWLDASGITVRRGDTRVLGPNAGLLAQ